MHVRSLGVAKGVDGEMELLSESIELKDILVSAVYYLLGTEILLLSEGKVAVEVEVGQAWIPASAVIVPWLIGTTEEDAGVAESTWRIYLKLVLICGAHTRILSKQPLILATIVFEWI